MLVPRHALTSVAPDASTILQAGFLDYIRVDATNEDTKNNLDDRAVEALALVPIGNRRGEWHCLFVFGCILFDL